MGAISKRKLLEVIQRKRTLASSQIDILTGTFPEQRAFITDPARLRMVFCTRRAAKSYSGGLALVDAALKNPGCNCLFLGLTRLSAKGIIWKDILKRINRDFDLGGVFNGTELTMTLPNGSVIWATGADADEDEMHKLLGKKYKRIVIDEGSMYSIDLKNLVYGVLKPATVDEGGDILLLGTASNKPRGLFFDVAEGRESGWSVHRWTAYQNPYVVKQWAEEIEDIRKNRPLYMLTAQYQQWYENKWAIDENARVYKFDPSVNVYRDLPSELLQPQVAGGWTYILGIDLGWEDDNAFTLMGYHEYDPHLWVFESYSEPRLTFDQVELVVKKYAAHPSRAPHKIIIDGANKQGVETMRRRTQIPFISAEKQDKVTFIELMNADFVQRVIRVHESNVGLIEELTGLTWKMDGGKPVLSKQGTKVEDPKLPNHKCDSLLYGWRLGFHYTHKTPEPLIAVGSKAWYDKQANDIWERERERLRADASMATLEQGLGYGDPMPTFMEDVEDG